MELFCLTSLCHRFFLHHSRLEREMKNHTLYSLTEDSHWLERAAEVVKDNVYEPSYYSSFDVHGQVYLIHLGIQATIFNRYLHIYPFGSCSMITNYLKHIFYSTQNNAILLFFFAFSTALMLSMITFTIADTIDHRIIFLTKKMLLFSF